MVGTRKVCSQRSRAASAMNAAASNFDIASERTPRTSEGRKKAPEACAIGAACRNVSPRLRSGVRSVRKADSSASSPRVVSVTAFDRPVVPPV